MGGGEMPIYLSDYFMSLSAELLKRAMPLTLSATPCTVARIHYLISHGFCGPFSFEAAGEVHREASHS